MIRILALPLLLAAIAVQPWVASDPVIHMVVQFPLLIGAGYLLARGTRLPSVWTGPLLVAALSGLAIWMLPRSLDAALTSMTGHLAKFTTLPMAVGMPLGLAWPRLGPILAGFLKAQAVSMLLFLAFLYTHAPVRICNSYLVADQHRLGLALACAALGLILSWSLPAFLGQPAPAITEKGLRP